MKIKVDIECTPKEARDFLGLPDIAPMQEKLMADLQERLEENFRSMDAETLAKTWLPMTMQGMGEMQKLFWENMKMAAPGATGSGKTDNDE